MPRKSQVATPAAPATPVAQVSPAQLAAVLAQLGIKLPATAPAQAAAKTTSKPLNAAPQFNDAGYLDLDFTSEVELTLASGVKVRAGRSRGRGNTYLRRS